MATPGVNPVYQGGDYTNEKGYAGPYAQAGYPPQHGYPQQGYPQQSYPQQGYPQQGHPAQGQAVPVGPDEFIDKDGNVRKRKRRGCCLAACLACCWCITWPCHCLCCGGL